MLWHTKANLPFWSPFDVTDPTLACWQAPPNWSAFHTCLPPLSSVAPHYPQHSARAPTWWSFPVWVLTFPTWITAPPKKNNWNRSIEPLTPRWSHGDPIPTFLLTESKVSSPKSFNTSLSPSLQESSQLFPFSFHFYLTICLIRLISTYGNKWLALYVSSLSPELLNVWGHGWRTKYFFQSFSMICQY